MLLGRRSGGPRGERELAPGDVPIVPTETVLGCRAEVPTQAEVMAEAAERREEALRGRK